MSFTPRYRVSIVPGFAAHFRRCDCSVSKSHLKKKLPSSERIYTSVQCYRVCSKNRLAQLLFLISNLVCAPQKRKTLFAKEPNHCALESVSQSLSTYTTPLHPPLTSTWKRRRFLLKKTLLSGMLFRSFVQLIRHRSQRRDWQIRTPKVVGERPGGEQRAPLRKEHRLGMYEARSAVFFMCLFCVFFYLSQRKRFEVFNYCLIVLMIHCIHSKRPESAKSGAISLIRPTNEKNRIFYPMNTCTAYFLLLLHALCLKPLRTPRWLNFGLSGVRPNNTHAVRG